MRVVCCLPLDVDGASPADARVGQGRFRMASVFGSSSSSTTPTHFSLGYCRGFMRVGCSLMTCIIADTFRLVQWFETLPNLPQEEVDVLLHAD